MSDHLFREVDEEVRQERFQQYWKRYGLYVAVVALVIVAGTIGYVVWQNLQESARVEASESFIAAINLANDDPAAARERLAAIAGDSTRGYEMLARLREAALLAEGGDAAAAVAAFDSVAADGDVDRLYRDLASLFAVANGLEVLSPDEVAQRIGHLDSSDTPLRFTARELLAVAALKAGDKARAGELLGAITDDPAAPAGSRARAAELLATLET